MILLKYSFLVGSIPVILNIKSSVGIFTMIPLGGSADVSVSFPYDSEAGFHYKGVDVNGQLGTVTVGNNEANTSAPSPSSRDGLRLLWKGRAGFCAAFL